MSATQEVATPVRQSNGADADMAQALRPRELETPQDSISLQRALEMMTMLGEQLRYVCSFAGEQTRLDIQLF